MADGTNPQAAQDDVDLYEAEPESYPFRVREKNGEVTQFYLRGFEGEGMATWMHTVARKMKADKKGLNSNTSDFRQFQASLIHLCCYDSAGNRVQINRIFGWAAKLQNALFEKCQELNGLNDESGDKAKKEVASPSGGSST